MKHFKQQSIFIFQEWFYVLAAAGCALWVSSSVDMTVATSVKEAAPQLASGMMLVPIGLGEFLALFVIVAALFFVLLKYLKGKTFFEILLFLAMFTGWYMIFGVLLSFYLAFFLALAVSAARYVIPRVVIHNLVLAGGIAGIAANFGLRFAIDPHTLQTPLLALFILLIFLSIYDWWAVKKSNILIESFESLVKRGVFMLLIIPRHLRDIGGRLDAVQRNGKFIFFGTGDFAIPLIFLVGIRGHGTGAISGTLLGMLAGFALDHWLFLRQEKRTPLPALPLIAFGSMLGFLVSRLVM